ncbi:GtrA family protein [Acidovorax sp. KKS102]|uniref:GtrA family protein n=1 Tax=Acidovorax sp. KKS102 TaxID=358220 RepID=UPI000143CE82|nr:GtrA family protein [Acidovorax sp. KKS102]AFU44352.1 GtrA family protein [Acidovorax sp. KKS102]
MNLNAWRTHTDFLLFAIIGILNTFVHGGVLMWAVEKLQLTLLLAHTLAFAVANLFSYIANSRITFKAPLSVLRYARFLLASLVALGLTLCIAWVTSRLGLHYQIGFVIIVFTVPLFSFAVIKFWAFAGHRSTPSQRV